MTLDLKGPLKDNKGYILYIIDSFSRLTRATIIKNKNPASVVKGILDTWVVGKGIGPGMPGKFYCDGGGEFNNPLVIDLAEKYGIDIHKVTASHSPFSNGTCERNHAIVDFMMKKIKSDDPSLKDTEALELALFAKNIETNNKGFSSHQIVYGCNPRLPGVTTSNPPSLSTTFTSEDVRKHLARINSG